MYGTQAVNLSIHSMWYLLHPNHSSVDANTPASMLLPIFICTFSSTWEHGLSPSLSPSLHTWGHSQNSACRLLLLVKVKWMKASKREGMWEQELYDGHSVLPPQCEGNTDPVLGQVNCPNLAVCHMDSFVPSCSQYKRSGSHTRVAS